MSESKTTIHVFPEVPPSVDKSIQNLTDLPTKGIGQTIADCWFLAVSRRKQKKRGSNMPTNLKNSKKNLNLQFHPFQNLCAKNRLAKLSYRLLIMQNIVLRKRNYAIYSLPF